MGSFQLTQLLVQSCDAGINTATYFGCTPLHTAAGRGQIAIVAYLVSVGANPAACTDEGDTPLDLSTSQPVSEFLTRVLYWLNWTLFNNKLIISVVQRRPKALIAIPGYLMHASAACSPLDEDSCTSIMSFHNNKPIVYALSVLYCFIPQQQTVCTCLALFLAHSTPLIMAVGCMWGVDILPLHACLY